MNDYGLITPTASRPSQARRPLSSRRKGVLCRRNGVLLANLTLLVVRDQFAAAAVRTQLTGNTC